MNEHGHPTVEDLDARERARALLPATSAILALLALALLAGFAYVSQQADAAQRRDNRNVALILRISTARFEYATNRSVCGFRKLADDSIHEARASIARSNAALKDPALKPGARSRSLKAKQDAQKQIATAVAFKASQVTVPFDYDCRELPAKPPPDTLPPK